MKSTLPTFVRGYVILQDTSLVRIRPDAYHNYSSLILVYGVPPNIFHLQIFGCIVYVFVAPNKRLKWIHNA